MRAGDFIIIALFKKEKKEAVYRRRSPPGQTVKADDIIGIL